METTSGTANTPEREFVEASRVFLKDDYMPKLLYCVEHLSEEDLWWRPNEASNSIGNLMLHLSGNVRQWIVASIGGEAFQRNRDAEFSEKGPLPRAVLVERLKTGLQDVDQVLAALESNRLVQQVTIQKYDVSVLQAVYHVVEHFSYHLGQILYIYKLRTGTDPRFYDL